MNEISSSLRDSDYAALADFRWTLRSFLAFSEAKAGEAGLTPQQHQALLAIRGAPAGKATVGYVAERLIIKPHSASELVNRLEALHLLSRQAAPGDKRKSVLALSARAEGMLTGLSEAHRLEVARLKPLLLDLLERLG